MSGMKLSVVMSIVVTLLFFCVSLVIWIHYYRRRSSNSSSKTPLEQAFPKITPAADHIHGGDANTASTMNMSEEEEERRTVERRIVHIRDGSAGLPGSSSGTSISSGSEAGKINPTNALRFCNRADASSFSAESSSYYSSPDASHSAWGHCYALKDLDLATESFSESKVVGRGGYGIVYHGILRDGTPIAVKRLVNNRGQAEREFKVEVEAIGRIRHKNLVRLLGYCMEDAHRILVYEYIDNGNLDQWLHGSLGENQSLPWDIRMKILLGTARGLAYLHEGLEPKVVHRDIKSSNILLDRDWNPKISDFGLAKLLGAENTHVTTRVMGTFGYVAPEYANTGLLNEKSDVYSYGVLLMELITGRDPVDYKRPQGEVNLVDWLKVMVASRQTDGVCDPNMEVKPSLRALKRALLVSLRCVDPDAEKRPKISHVIHMLEIDDNPFNEQKGMRQASSRSMIGQVDSDSGRSTDNDSNFPKLVRSESGSDSEPSSMREKLRKYGL